MPSRPKLVIATGNAGKLGEYRQLLADAGVEIVAFDDDVEEVGETYAENARIKADNAIARSGLASRGEE